MVVGRGGIKEADDGINFVISPLLNVNSPGLTVSQISGYFMIFQMVLFWVIFVNPNHVSFCIVQF